MISDLNVGNSPQYKAVVPDPPVLTPSFYNNKTIQFANSSLYIAITFEPMMSFYNHLEFKIKKASLEIY